MSLPLRKGSLGVKVNKYNKCFLSRVYVINVIKKSTKEIHVFNPHLFFISDQILNFMGVFLTINIIILYKVLLKLLVNNNFKINKISI